MNLVSNLAFLTDDRAAAKKARFPHFHLLEGYKNHPRHTHTYSNTIVNQEFLRLNQTQFEPNVDRGSNFGYRTFFQEEDYKLVDEEDAKDVAGFFCSLIVRKDVVLLSEQVAAGLRRTCFM